MKSQIMYPEEVKRDLDEYLLRKLEGMEKRSPLLDDETHAELIRLEKSLSRLQEVDEMCKALANVRAI